MSKKIGKNLAKMRVRHLLSMNTGFNRCLIDDIRRSDDPVREFLRFEPELEPGTHFFYNNAATFMLGQIVRRFTHMSIYDYLEFKLYEPLGIKAVRWDTYTDGNEFII